MAIIPETRRGKIDFYVSHLEAWAAHAAQIGVTPAEVAALADKVAAARAALRAQQEAEQAARAATAVFHEAVALMHTDGMTLLGAIRQTAAQAGASGGQSAAVDVFVAAQVPPNAPRRPVPPPGTPSALQTTLLPDGSLRLTWKCRNPRGAAGTMYEIRRRDGGERGTPLVHVGLVGGREFVDPAPPAGTGQIVYAIRAVRGKHTGGEAYFPVNLGVRPLRVAQPA